MVTDMRMMAFKKRMALPELAPVDVKLLDVAMSASQPLQAFLVSFSDAAFAPFPKF
jgi:hypothetical protein